MKVYETAIIGAGPAGIAAAIQLRRFGLDFILLDRRETGGLLNNANLVENYPGFPHGISGPALVQRFIEQMQSYGIQVVKDDVIRLSFTEGIFHLYNRSENVQARTVIISSGTKPKTFTDFNIPASIKTKVFYEVSPLTHLLGKRIAIIGAGDAAFDYALNLAQCNQIFILNHSDHTSCLPLLWERSNQSPQITYLACTQVKRVAAKRTGELLLDCATIDGIVPMEVDYLIGALGRDPQTDFLTPEIESSRSILESQGLLYWSGDVQNGRYRQTAIAVGDGMRAAMKIYHRLMGDTQ